MAQTKRPNPRRKGKRREKETETTTVKGRSNTNGRDEAAKQFAGAHLDSTGRDNDPGYYFVDPEVASQAAELSFQDFLGQGKFIDGYEVPTFITYAMNPCPGNSYYVDRTDLGGTHPSKAVYGEDMQNGLNMMSAKIYTLLSTYTGRTSNYMPADVGMMILAISSFAEISEHVRRVIGLALTYASRNRFMPKELLNALGVDADDFNGQIANYRMRFNTIISRINQIPLLDNVAYVRKARMLYQKIYKDSESSMAQMYAYVPATAWVLDESLKYADATILMPKGAYRDSVVTTQLQWGKCSKLKGWLDLMDEQVTALLSSTTLNLIYADLLNLANKISVPLWQFDYLPESYVVYPEVSRNSMLQVHNMDIVGVPKAFGTSNVVEETTGGYKLTAGNIVAQDVEKNALLYNPAFRGVRAAEQLSLLWSRRRTVVDMDTDKPTIEDRIESLRFSVLSSGFTTDGVTLHGGEDKAKMFLSLPDHYCVEMKIFTNNGNRDNAISLQSNAVNEAEPESTWSALEKWHSAPLFYVELNDPNYECVGYVKEVMGDLDFYTTVDYRYLSRLNRLMYVGLFDFRT